MAGRSSRARGGPAAPGWGTHRNQQMSPAGPAIARGPEKWSDMGLLLRPMVAQVSRPPALAAVSGLDVGALPGRQGRRAPAGRPAAGAGPS